MSTHIYTHDECKKLIDELGIIKHHNGRIDVIKKNITPLLMESILFHTNKCRDNLSERIYWIINDIEDYFNCSECGNYFIPRFYGIGSNYSKGNFCSTSCAVKNKETQNKMQTTSKERYGYKHPNQSPEIRAKTEATCEERYGYKNVWSSPEIREKCSQTCEEKYGYRNPQQCPEIQEKIKLTCLERYNVEYTFQSPIVQEKCQQTCLERHGHRNPMQNLEIRTKAQNTCEERYGHRNPMQSSGIRTKTEATCEERYGYKNVLSSPEIQEKCQQTCLERHGHRNPLQNVDIFLKQQQTACKLKKLILPSGKEILYQGYENVGILSLLINGYLEEQLILDRNLIPKIDYIFNEKNKVYYPDIYITHENKIIEIKSTWTYKRDLEQNLAKRQACLNQGYQFEFWICSDKKVLEII